MRNYYSQQQLARTRYITHLIGDEWALLVLYELTHFGEKSFNELKRMTGANQVTLSKKLLALRKEGLVDSRPVGKENHYFVTDKAQYLSPIMRDIEHIASDNTPL